MLFYLFKYVLKQQIHNRLNLGFKVKLTNYNDHYYEFLIEKTKNSNKKLSDKLRVSYQEVVSSKLPTTERETK